MVACAIVLKNTDHLQKSWSDPEDSRGQGTKGSSEMLKSFKELKVWQKSYQLCLEIYRITKGFSKEERYGLTSQIRRAIVSVPSNIAEGYR
jgi:hypothetical protein